MQKRIFYSIDLFKFISAFLVVAIHVYPFLDLSATFNTYFLADLCRLAVPFYFVSSGFLFFRKQKALDSQHLMHYEIRVGLLYGCWTLIYIPLILVQLFNSDNFFMALLSWVRDFFLTGSYYHLWFLPALMLGMALLVFMLRKMKTSTVLWITLILYLIGWQFNIFGSFWQTVPLIGTLYDWYTLVFVTARNGIFFAPVYLMMGYLIAQIGTPGKKTCAIGLVISWLLLILEVLIYSLTGFLEDLSSMFLFLIPTLYFLFGLVIRMKLPRSRIWPEMRKEATLIYVSHIYFAVLFLIFLPNNHLLVYALVMIFSILVSWGIIRLQKSVPWLKILW